MSEPLYKLKGEFFKTLGHPPRIRIPELLAVPYARNSPTANTE